MEKKVYLVTCTRSCGCDAEITVFKSKKDAFADLLERIEISKSVGWVVSYEKDDFIEMVNPSYRWGIVYKVTEKTLF